MLIVAQNINYTLPTHRVLFQDINFTLNKGEKAAIAGNNGTGKSTLLKMLAGHEPVQTGTISKSNKLYYVPQHFGQYSHFTVAQALGIDRQLQALAEILDGNTSEHFFEILGDDWDLHERCLQALDKWGLTAVQPEDLLSRLSGGEKTKVFLAGIDLFKPATVLLDEPTNHLDAKTRQQLYEWIATTNCTLLVVSHDRQLLMLCNPIWELQPSGIKAYGGNYAFYESQKADEAAALQHRIDHQEKTLKEAKKQQQMTIQRKQRTNAQHKKKGQEGGIPKIVLNARKQFGENSLTKLQQVHTEKVAGIQHDLEKTSAMEQVSRIMKGHFEQTPLHNGKILINASGINFAYEDAAPLWKEPLDLTIVSGNRIAVSGPNGCGKSTLIKLIMGSLTPQVGELFIAPVNCLLLDQDYSIVDREKTVLQQAISFNKMLLEISLLKTVLVRFLFDVDSWEKPCSALSGGEMLRLALCSMTLLSRTPDIILLDEPANNLDLNNIKMLTQIFLDYKGTLVVISHDTTFLEEVGITSSVVLGR